MVSPKILLQSAQIHPRKRLGQNFLCDRQAAEMIVRRADLKPDETVLEIGAGTGALTLPAAHWAARLYAVETDERLIAPLQNNLQAAGLENVRILPNDILKTDLEPLFQEAGGRLTVIGNLPYNISSQILMKLIQERHGIDRAVLMLQTELAERLVAPPGGKNYGRPSVMLRYCAEVSTLARLKPDLFFPRPRVSSRVIAIAFKTGFFQNLCQEQLLFAIIKAAFAKRRKTLRNALSNQELGLCPEICRAALKAAGIEDRTRAERLDAPDYVAICQHYLAIQAGAEKAGPTPASPF